MRIFQNSVFVLIALCLFSCKKDDESDVPETIDNVLIDDFEDGNYNTSLGSGWYHYNDNPNGGNSRLDGVVWDDVIDSDGGYSSFGINADFILEKASYTWDPYYTIATEIEKTDLLNPSDFDGISYWHKGVAHDFRIDIEEVTDYDNHFIAIPASAEWTLVTIDYDDLLQEGWGNPVALNLDNDIKLIWNINQTSGSFQIDDIYFVGEIIYEKQYDMEILPEEIPEPLAVSGDVNTPLNTLSKQYLTKGMNFTNWGEQEKITSADPSTWKFDEASVELQASQGILGIRLPIDLDLYIDDRDNVLNGTNDNVVLDPILFAVLDSFNIWTKRHDLSLTIDYHAYDGTYNRANSKDQEFREAMASLWRVVAEHFVGETREDLFFELTNEPGLSLPTGESIDQADWTLLAGMMIDSIRTVDATRPLIFGDTDWYSLDKLVLNTPFADEYIIYAFHMYDPFVFTHQGASWSSMTTTKDIPFPYSEERWSTEYRDFGFTDATPDWAKNSLKNYYKEGNKQHIKNRLAKVKNWASLHNVPLICNEWGAYPKSAKIEDLNAYFQTMGEIFEEMDISWQVWFGIMDDDYILLPGMEEALDL